jgi:hypothetical protein
MDAAEKATLGPVNTFLIGKKDGIYQINNERLLRSYVFYGLTETEK